MSDVVSGDQCICSLGSGLASSVKTDLEDLTKFDYSFYSLSQKGYQDELQQKFVKKMNSLGLQLIQEKGR